MSPTVTIQFALPDEQPEYVAAVLGRQARSTLWHIDQHCRSITKHGEPSDEVRRLCEQIREMIPDVMLDDFA